MEITGHNYWLYPPAASLSTANHKDPFWLRKIFPVGLLTSLADSMELPGLLNSKCQNKGRIWLKDEWDPWVKPQSTSAADKAAERDRESVCVCSGINALHPRLSVTRQKRPELHSINRLAEACCPCLTAVPCHILSVQVHHPAVWFPIPVI